MIRSIRTAAPAFAALIALTATACSDAPVTAPNALDDMKASEAIVVIGRPTATLTMMVRDYTTALMVGGTTVAFVSGPTGNTPKNVLDNSAEDSDKRDGYFKVVMPKNTTYTATVIAAISKYDRINAMLQVASTANNVNLGTVNLRTNPLISVYVRRAYDNAFLGGAQYSVGWADGLAPFMTRTDNVDDMSSTVGIVKFYGKSARNHQICEIKAPAGYLIPVQSCKTIAASWNDQLGVQFLHY